MSKSARLTAVWNNAIMFNIEIRAREEVLRLIR